MDDEFCCACCPAWRDNDYLYQGKRTGECRLAGPQDYQGTENTWPVVFADDFCLDGAAEAGWERVQLLDSDVWIWARVPDPPAEED